MIATTEIVSFDRTERHICKIARPEKYSDLIRLSGQRLIARGAGLSYCNASAAEDALVVDMRRMNCILDFNKERLTVTVESGIAIGELNNFLFEHGYRLTVLPGYPMITVGGCVAFNVHGKSQFKTGTFGAIVKELVVLKPDGTEVKCSLDSETQFFRLTIGGMGLTGIILNVTLSIEKLKGNVFEITRKQVANIFESVEVMQSGESTSDTVYSWNNLNLKAGNFGKGIVYSEQLAEGKPVDVVYKNRLGAGYKLPALHTSLSIKMMCAVYYQLEKFKGNKSIKNYAEGSFPIYNKEIYFHLFGKKGFLEYQLLLPHLSFSAAAEQIRKLIDKLNIPVALGSLKLFKGDSQFLNFNGSGVCLAMDVAYNQKGLQFFGEIDKIVLDHGGIVNLSKDSRISAEMVRRMFPGYDAFRTALAELDPQQRIGSSLKTRIGL